MLDHYILNNTILNKAYSYVLFYNPSNSAPYHNFNHLLTVAKSCLEMATYYDLSDLDKETLVLSAIFHDFNHSAGLYKDDINVPRALTALKDFCLKFEYPHFEKCQDIILATFYPYNIATVDLTFVQKIIRDADMTQCLQIDWLQQCVFGLGKEFGISTYDSLTGQVAFLSNMQANTDWLQMEFDIKLPAILEDIKCLIKKAELVIISK